MKSDTVLIETLTGDDLYTRIDHENGEYTFNKVEHLTEISTPTIKE